MITREKENCHKSDEQNCQELVTKRPFIQDADGDKKGDMEIIYTDNAKQRLYVKELPSLIIVAGLEALAGEEAMLFSSG